MSISISKIHFEHHREALGIGESQPRISWRFDGNVVDWQQSAYEIEVVQGQESQSKIYQVFSNDSSLVKWPSSPLTSGQLAQVRVRAHGQSGQASTPWSPWASVEAGLLEEKDWDGAVPISGGWDISHDKPKKPVYFRKTLLLDAKTIQSARLYITALGLYEAHINGQRVGDHVLAPGWQSYHHRHVYNTFDVTSLLHEGQNAIGVIVAEGWYCGRMFSFDPNVTRNHWGDNIGLLLLLNITFRDGSNARIPTDLSWEATAGPILDAQIYDGESYDSRLEYQFTNWTTPSFDSSNWRATAELPPLKGVLMPPDAPPVRMIEECKPVRIWTSPKGNILVDFGQNLAGWVRIKASGESGDKIVLSHAELLEQGELAIDPLRSAKAQDTFILNGQPNQVLQPHFTYHGFRYIRIDGWPRKDILNEASVTAIVVHTDLEETGQFHSSNALLNQFHNNVRWSMKGNFISIPTDCPQRDERIGWTGDVTAFAATSNFLYDCSGFWRGWHRDVWAEMRKDGLMRVPYYVPDTAPSRPMESEWPPAPTAVWGDVTVVGPWQCWLAYGDMVMLAEQYSQSQSWIDIGIERDEMGLWNKSGYQWGDWLDPLAPESSPGDATTSKYLVADAYLIGMTDLLMNMSVSLGKADQADKYKRQSTKLRQVFAETWLTVDGQMTDRTQTAYSLGLYFDIFNNDSHRRNAAQTFRDIVYEINYHIGTGFAGTWTLGHAFRKANAVEDFYKMLLQTGVPSWLYQVINGGTTTWERWDSLLPDGTVNGCGMTSFNHYAFGSVADWIHRTVGGLAPASPGWKEILIAPVPGGNITSAEVSYTSSYGTIEVRWWIEDHEDAGASRRNGFHLRAKVPPNTRARVVMPDIGKKFDIGSGVYEFYDPEYCAASVEPSAAEQQEQPR